MIQQMMTIEASEYNSLVVSLRAAEARAAELKRERDEWQVRAEHLDQEMQKIAKTTWPDGYSITAAHDMIKVATDALSTTPADSLARLRALEAFVIAFDAVYIPDDGDVVGIGNLYSARAAVEATRTGKAER